MIKAINWIYPVKNGINKFALIESIKAGEDKGKIIGYINIATLQKLMLGRVKACPVINEENIEIDYGDEENIEIDYDIYSR